MPPSRDRALRVVELLARHPDGLPMSEIAETLAIPKTAIHRLLAELQAMGYLHQLPDARFSLTVKIISVALDYLAATGLMDVVQPHLDALARHCQELVRLAVANQQQLTWIAKAQGAGPGLRYEPRPDGIVNLSATATGLSWLATLPEDQALRLITAQGLAPHPTYGPQAPRSIQAVLAHLDAARAQGYAFIGDANENGMSAVGIPIFAPGIEPAIGALCITGPSYRCTVEHMQALIPAAQETADALGRASRDSPLLSQYTS